MKLQIWEPLFFYLVHKNCFEKRDVKVQYFGIFLQKSLDLAGFLNYNNLEVFKASISLNEWLWILFLMYALVDYITSLSSLKYVWIKVM